MHTQLSALRHSSLGQTSSSNGGDHPCSQKHGRGRSWGPRRLRASLEKPFFCCLGEAAINHKKYPHPYSSRHNNALGPSEKGKNFELLATSVVCPYCVLKKNVLRTTQKSPAPALWAPGRWCLNAYPCSVRVLMDARMYQKSSVGLPAHRICFGYLDIAHCVGQSDRENTKIAGHSHEIVLPREKAACAWLVRVA